MLPLAQAGASRFLITSKRKRSCSSLPSRLSFACIYIERLSLSTSPVSSAICVLLPILKSLFESLRTPWTARIGRLGNGDEARRCVCHQGSVLVPEFDPTRPCEWPVSQRVIRAEFQAWSWPGACIVRAIASFRVIVLWFLSVLWFSCCWKF